MQVYSAYFDIWDHDVSVVFYITNPQLATEQARYRFSITKSPPDSDAPATRDGGYTTTFAAHGFTWNTLASSETMKKVRAEMYLMPEEDDDGTFLVKIQLVKDAHHASRARFKGAVPDFFKDATSVSGWLVMYEIHDFHKQAPDVF